MGKIDSIIGMAVSIFFMIIFSVLINIIGDDAREAMKIGVETGTHSAIYYVYVVGICAWVLSTIMALTFMVRVGFDL